MGTMQKPDIFRKTIIIDDDFIRSNRRADGTVRLTLGGANENNQIVLNKYELGKNITLLDDIEIEKLKQRINSNSESVIQAHELHHIHNGAIGYNYLANSDNIYECMILSFADEMSAMLAGYLKKFEDIDMALMETMRTLSKNIRQEYMSGQFYRHFKKLQQIHGKNKNLYRYTFDAKKIHNILRYYFTINGQQVMEKISDRTKNSFSSFMVTARAEIIKFIEMQIFISKNAQKDIL
jgi:hypothetical protein